MAAFAFSLPIFSGQEVKVRCIGKLVWVWGADRQQYEESRRQLGIKEEEGWMQETPIGQAMIVYWETDDPQRTLREIADSQDEFVKQFRELIPHAAPALYLSQRATAP